jgi:hypothetical protein
VDLEGSCAQAREWHFTDIEISTPDQLPTSGAAKRKNANCFPECIDGSTRQSA